MTNAVPMLRAFERDGDRLVGEWPINGLGLTDLRHLLEANEDLCDSYRVEPVQAPALERATGQLLDFARFEYFVDVDAG